MSGDNGATSAALDEIGGVGERGISFIFCKDRLLTQKQISTLLSLATKKLLDQFQYSNGFTSKGQSALAEASLVMHIGAECIAEKHAVWPESPFRTEQPVRTKQRDGTNHLDLLVHLNPEDPRIQALLIEVKAISRGHEVTKVNAILDDWNRLQSWRSLRPGGIPLSFEFDRVKTAYALVAVLFTAEVDSTGQIVRNDFGNWWETLRGCPEPFSEGELTGLRNALKSSCRWVKRSHYFDGGRKHSVAIALKRV